MEASLQNERIPRLDLKSPSPGDHELSFNELLFGHELSPAEEAAFIDNIDAELEALKTPRLTQKELAEQASMSRPGGQQPESLEWPDSPPKGNRSNAWPSHLGVPFVDARTGEQLSAADVDALTVSLSVTSLGTCPTPSTSLLALPVRQVPSGAPASLPVAVGNERARQRVRGWPTFSRWRSGRPTSSPSHSDGARGQRTPRTDAVPSPHGADELAPPIPLPKLVGLLGLRNRDVLNVFCCGSRLFGGGWPESCYELLLVHRAKDHMRLTTRNLTSPFVCATLVHAEEWATRLRDHQPLELFLTWHPYPWRLRLSPLELGFVHQPKKVLHSLVTNSLSDWKQACEYLQATPPQLRQARETLLRLLRQCMLGCELLEHGRVIDFTVAETLRQELEGYDSTSWLWWQTTFEPRLEELQTRLRRLAIPIPVVPAHLLDS